MPPGGGGIAGGGRSFGNEEGETEIPSSRRRGILDFDEEEVTELPKHRRGDDDDADKTELNEPPSITLGMLWAKEGSRRGHLYPIKHGTVIGRKEGKILLDDPKVSSRHAKFTVEDDDFVVWDLASANGTYVNDKQSAKRPCWKRMTRSKSARHFSL